MFSKIRYTVTITLLFCLALGAQQVCAQVKLPTIFRAQVDTTKKDTAKPAPRIPVSKYAKLINSNFVTQKGLFTVHKYKDTVYFEIPDSMLHRDIMVINRLTKAPGGYGMYAGEELDEKTITFEKGPDSSIRIRYDLFINQADSSSDIFKAVVTSSVNPVIVSFPVKAYGEDSGSYVIDVSKFLTDKTLVNNIDANTRLGQNLNTVTMKDFYLESINAYPMNIEVRVSKNVNAKKGGYPGDPVTLESQTSFIVLPKVPLQQRLFDPRVGYFADYYFAYGDHQQKVDRREFILRWRLEAKAADVAKWEKGELVEPQKPIVIYIDPATPKQWRPYLIQGINDWQAAFEQAGFKNAIIGKEWPENDTTMSMEDARFSMLNYLPSDVANAYGPQVHDPRSGEIIQTHIGWYHNVMSLLHDWYMIQTAAVDPKARKAKFDEPLMGELIRFVSSHEVGHTLGLRHNFGSSSRTPVDSLRSRTYLQTHGHTASIMDYARFNYVAQPEDHIPQQELFPHIGEYDRWAIEWGYKSAHVNTVEEDKVITRRWIVDHNAKNPRLWFGDGESKKTDARCQTEDLGDNAVKASEYGIKNLKRILPHLPEWTYEEGGIHENLTDMYKALKDQYSRYMTHVLKNIGAVYQTYQNDGAKADVYAPVPKELQQDAVDFFNRELFTTPRWLMDTAVLNKVNTIDTPIYVQDAQVRMLNSLLDVKRINSLLNQMQQFGARAYPADKYLTTLHQGIWKELNAANVVVDNYRRNLQKAYVGSLMEVMISKDAEATETDASSMLKADMYLLQKQIAHALPKTTDLLTKVHLMDLQHRIKSALSEGHGD